MGRSRDTMENQSKSASTFPFPPVPTSIKIPSINSIELSSGSGLPSFFLASTFGQVPVT